MTKIPKYKSIRIFIVSGIFYFFLVMPFMGFIWIQKLPEYIDRGLISGGGASGQIGPLQFSTDSIPLANDRIQLDSLQNFIDPKIKSTLPDLNEKGISPDIAGPPDKFTPINDLYKGFQEGSSSPDAGLSINDKDDRPAYFGTSFDIFFYGIEIALLVVLILSYPFKRYFRRKRKGKEVSARLEFFCRRYLLKTPIIYAGIYSLVMLATIGYIAYINLFVDYSNSINAGILEEYFYIATLSGFLSTIFVFYWHKHRVHIFYLEVLYHEDELRKRIFRNSLGKIRNRLWLASGMTTLLPLTIVIFYLVLSVSKISDLNLDLTNQQIRSILLGNYEQLFVSNNLENLFYVNSINAYMMFIGIGTSIFISLIYILTFVRWTTLDIVLPVKELLGNMQKTGEGKTTNFSIVRTNDEIGELTEGFNIMSQRIKNYIDNISEINQSYYRFVPKQFLDFLDKKSITDIHLGDQVQKEMTVMFSDIRSFTEISEKLSPRENFNFINHYLGYMEPIISRNHGFIDKYIGDAIMALFPDSPDDAINAAIEMRTKLYEFNNDLNMSGRPSIDSGIGINTGNLMLGIVGGKGRIEGTVISDHVNLASRLEGLTKKYETPVVISQDTLIKLKSPQNYQFRFLDTVRVKGKRNSVNIFEILDGEKPKIRETKIRFNPQFKQGLQFYRNKDIESALKIFSDILKESQHDKVIEIYIDRCKSLLAKGIPDEWDIAENWENK